MTTTSSLFKLGSPGALGWRRAAVLVLGELRGIHGPYPAGASAAAQPPPPPRSTHCTTCYGKARAVPQSPNPESSTCVARQV